MSKTEVKDSSLSSLGLLKTVVEFKNKFYPQSWARYEDAVPGTIKLIPPQYRMPRLTADYELMKDMIFGDKPDFETIMNSVHELEEEINNL